MDIIAHELRPPEPQLLDTCVLQNLDWVDQQIESTGTVTWDDAAIADLAGRYGIELASDLVALGILYKEFEDRSGYPWLVCQAAQAEVCRAGGGKGRRLVSMLNFVRGHQDCWSNDTYPAVATGFLFAPRQGRVSPVLLRGLGVTSVDEVSSASGPLSFLPDEGDRLVVAAALLANVPVVLTTDRRTFWKYRAELDAYGLAVMRPTELLNLYEPYWQAQDEEFARRRHMCSR
jgi:hypothetical protein